MPTFRFIKMFCSRERERAWNRKHDETWNRATRLNSFLPLHLAILESAQTVSTSRLRIHSSRLVSTVAPLYEFLNSKRSTSPPASLSSLTAFNSLLASIRTKRRFSGAHHLFRLWDEERGGAREEKKNEIRSTRRKKDDGERKGWRKIGRVSAERGFHSADVRVARIFFHWSTSTSGSYRVDYRLFYGGCNEGFLTPWRETWTHASWGNSCFHGVVQIFYGNVRMIGSWEFLILCLVDAHTRIFLFYDNRGGFFDSMTIHDRIMGFPTSILVDAYSRIACFVSCSMAVGVDVVQIFFYLWRMYDIFYSGLMTRTRIATRAFFYITMIVVGIFLHYDGWREKFYATSFLLRGDTNAWVSYSGSYSGFFRLIPGGYYGGRFLTLWRVTWMYASWGIFYFIDIDVCVVQIFYSVAKHTWPDHENFLFYASWCTRGLYHEDFSILSRWLWGSLIRLTCYRDFLFYGESRDIRVMTISLYLLTWQTTYVSWNFLFCDIHRRIRSHSGKIFFLFDEGKISYSTAADVNARVT